MRNSALTLIIMMLLSGCSPTAAPTEEGETQRTVQADEIEKKKWQAEGWSYVETVGTPVEGAERRPFLQSDNAPSVTAVAFDGAKQVRKVFSQSNHVYLLVNMGNSDKTYTHVFRRAKPAQPDAPPNGGPEAPLDNPSVTEARHR